MNKVFILHSKFFDYNGEKFSIGGVETYIYNLSKLLMKNNYEVTIYQFANENFEKKYQDINIKGIKVDWKKFNKAKKRLYDIFAKTENPNFDSDVVLFGTDYMICKNKFKQSIAIQHGVSWDINSYQKEKNIVNILHILKNSIGAIKKYVRYSRVKKMVCVDYNFVNWYRTQIKNVQNELTVIPNFVENVIDSRNFDNESTIKIIFARRFVEYRGTRVFADVMKRILEKFPNVFVTIAGEGPDEEYMLKQLEKYKNRFKIISYKPEESFEIHKQHHIAVVPTLGSEGTSLSLLEAMGAGCAVVATNVGGITNILLNGYNGIIVSPDKESLQKAIEQIINDNTKLKNLSQNAIKTTKEVFNKDIWDALWIDIFSQLKEE